MRHQRFTPLIYRGSVRKRHRSLYGGISACPTRNSLTLTCGLRPPACHILVTTISSQSRQENYVSEQDTSETHGSSIQSTNGNHVQETPKSSNILRFSLLFISIIITILVAPFFLTDNIFNICVFFATFTTLIFALTDLIIYLSKEPPHPIIIHIDSIEKENKKLTRTPYLS